MFLSSSIKILFLKSYLESNKKRIISPRNGIESKMVLSISQQGGSLKTLVSVFVFLFCLFIFLILSSLKHSFLILCSKVVAVLTKILNIQMKDVSIFEVERLSPRLITTPVPFPHASVVRNRSYGHLCAWAKH